MKTWDLKRTTYSVSDFLSWQRQGTLVLSPSFQRRSVWRKGAKSYLIDTILRGLPVPVIIMRDQNTDLDTFEPKREIVDGQQRLRTLLSFIEPSSINDFNTSIDAFTISRAHNKKLANKTFSELNALQKQRILDYEFSVHILPSKVGDREVLEIFARMNATGEKLNDQELRNAEYFGEFKSLMFKLASEQLDRWRDWRIFTENNISRMQEVELTSEFGILCIRGISDKKKTTINKIYTDYDEDLESADEIQKRIRNTFEVIDENFSVLISKSVFKKKTLFYSLFASIYELLYGLGSELNSKKPKKLPKAMNHKFEIIDKKFKEDEVPQNVIDSSTKATNNASSRRIITNFLVKEFSDD